ncbi:hypothetical protein AB0G55_14005 [Streptomyces toyocaensis]|uniref:hypothetical protein n=1 Tax=Streptomyces toyocaensis TaxID=55952 RepID=UPI000B16639E|nr:hypothetical protein [Streptomyces toyocaensis]
MPIGRSKDEVRKTTEAFFAAWEEGQADRAASYTDNALHLARTARRTPSGRARCR